MFVEDIQYDEIRPKTVNSSETKPWIVVAEDHGPMRDLVSLLLSSEGYQVTTAKDGSELTSILGEAMSDLEHPKLPDLVVTDVRMPMTSGLTVLESMRNAGWNLPVVVISSFADQEMRRKATELGAVLLSKPNEMPQLVSTVRELLSKSKVGVKDWEAASGVRK